MSVPEDNKQAATEHHLFSYFLSSPTQAMLDDPRFEAIWQVIKTWDINVPNAYAGYCGANGSHVRAIMDALAPVARRPVQVALAASPNGYITLVALADDGTLWERTLPSGSGWQAFPPLPKPPAL